jgi:hypothetical protein
MSMTTFNIDKSRGYVGHQRGGNVHYVCTSHGNPLVSIRAESCEGSSRLPALVAMMEAAPALLDACEAALDVLDNMTSEDFSLGKDKPVRAVLRAAIAKATGQD